MQDSDSPKPKIHKASRILQAKIGSGPIDEATVEKCQDVIDNNDVDFKPLAEDYLDKLSKAMANIEQNPDLSVEAGIESLTAPVMQLKANAPTFQYPLIGRLANVMLSFLESIRMLDKDALAIVEAHQRTLQAIIQKEVIGDGGAFGQQMEEELKNACKRYFAKKG